MPSSRSMPSVPSLFSRPVATLLLAALLTACTATPKPTSAPATPAEPAVTAAQETAAQETATQEMATQEMAAAGGETDSSPWADTERDLPLDPAIRHGRLDNGLSYYVRAHGRPDDRAELRLAVNAGSILEEDDQRGLAHFVEHMAFNGTEGFARQELVGYLESIGMRFGPDLNAYTSFDETVYMLKVPTDDAEIVDQAFRILRDWAGGIAFEDAEIDKERGVVVEEWRLGRGAGARLRDLQYPILYRGSRYAERLPIGDPEIIEGAPYDTVRRFYRDWYRPDLMAVVAVGDFDAEAVEKMIRETFGDLRNPDPERERQVFEVPDHRETLVSVNTDPEMTRTMAEVYYKLPDQPEGSVGDYRRSLLESLHHAMLNDRLAEISRRPDPPFTFAQSFSGSAVRSREVYYQAAGVRGSAVETALAALLTEAERVDRHGFTEGELERIKADVIRFYEQAYAEREKIESGSYADEYVRNFLEGEPAPGIGVELEVVRDLLPGIGLEELNRLSREWISETNRVILVSAPESEKESLPDEAALLAVFHTAEAAEIDPWVDRVADRPLVETPPQPGRVVAEDVFEEIGVTSWRLANGVRVVVKPTDFKNDEVLLSAFSPGGHSLVPAEEYPSAAFAATVLRQGGVGPFDRTQLDKLLAGKIVDLSAGISELDEGFTGISSPDDLETLLQLVYLQATEPRADPDAFRSFIARAQAMIANRLADPSAVFQDALSHAMFGDEPRRQPISTEFVAAIDLEAAKRIFRDRFGDAGDFTFLLVGAIDPATVRPLVETYLGGLPAAGRQESPADLDIHPPDEPIEVEVRAGLEPKSQVRLSYHGPAIWSREHVHDILSLEDALRLRLREVLREDLGGTYGVSIFGSIDPSPEDRYAVGISFGCDPAEADSLLEALRAELDRVRREGFTADEVAKVQEIQRRERESQLEENGFWIAVLESYLSRDIDPRLILEFDPLIDQLTPEHLRQVAERYLVEGRTVLGVLRPE